ncbi:hypothetical protein ASD99_02380 [Mesorhizobium sp. Root695]|uniref:Crp/Fnr family transcriptional regulator n=1 Tax=Mesorhizobium sp. Root695 TaxID=1736589 RepID=UPI00071092BD|nr:Crp/Fnr family transcriptional regulator [Mesorhizobium sp. Root695]KRB34471.1 hypothetical protein ASD99_02380 [Mesorhizobium sp. Root695]
MAGMQDLSAAIERAPIFLGLDKHVLARIARIMRPQRIGAGRQVLVEGEPCTGLFLVVEGQIRLIKSTAEGRDQVLGILGPGATFNEIAVFDGGPNPFGAVSVGAAFLGFLPKSDMIRLLDQHPEVARAALKILSSRQRSLGSMVEDLALRDVTVRVARLLLGCVGHHGHIIESAETACEHITHQEIASMVGSVREVAQRALKQLERDGAISLQRSRVCVRDVSKLKAWAGGAGNAGVE